MVLFRKLVFSTARNSRRALAKQNRLSDGVWCTRVRTLNINRHFYLEAFYGFDTQPYDRRESAVIINISDTAALVLGMLFLEIILACYYYLVILSHLRHLWFVTFSPSNPKSIRVFIVSANLPLQKSFSNLKVGCTKPIKNILFNMSNLFQFFKHMHRVQ